ncbi:MAG: EFR1 family ferrodoxin [Dehalococcoidales bacterium]|nr:EFR1 family ferrodoxin [Dehalococcoidales bacterium]
MSTSIYYFSGTGNTLCIARGLKERLTDAEIMPIVPLLKNKTVLPETESIGICFPIQSFSYPWVAAEFLSKLDLSRVAYIFALSSRHCFYKVFTDLEKDSLASRKFDACFSIQMPQNYIPMFKTPLPDEVKEADRNMEADLDAIAGTIQKRETYRPKDSPLWYPISRLIFPLFTRYFRKTRLPDMGRSFFSDENCTGCGTCEKVCLTDRIKMVNGRPQWLDNVKCAYCFACLHLCPAQSVQIKGRNTEKKQRYHHPSVTVNDIISQKYA